MQWDAIVQSAQSVATVLATLAAVWAAYDARRSRKIAEAVVRPEPIVTATMVEGSPFEETEATIYLLVRNRADVDLTVESASLDVPGYQLAGGGTVAECGHHVDRLRGDGDDGNERTIILRLERTRPVSPAKRASMILRMLWQDHKASALAITVTIVQLVVSSDSQ